MTPEVRASLAPVVEEIGVQLDLLDAHGATYVREYLEHTMNGGKRPATPHGMRPEIAKALREMALDQATEIRLYGTPRRRRGGESRGPRRFA